MRKYRLILRSLLLHRECNSRKLQRILNIRRWLCYLGGSQRDSPECRLCRNRQPSHRWFDAEHSGRYSACIRYRRTSQPSNGIHRCRNRDIPACNSRPPPCNSSGHHNLNLTYSWARRSSHCSYSVLHPHKDRIRHHRMARRRLQCTGHCWNNPSGPNN